MDGRLKEAQDSFNKSQKDQSHIYNSMKEDLYFLSDNEFSQWDDKAVASRKGKDQPIVQIDLLNQYVHQVVNDIRMNTPTINPIPATNGDKDTADIIKGLIRDIEYKSNADNAYDMAANFQVKGSLGWIRIDHDYESTRSNDQVLQIKRVLNTSAIYIDSNSTEPDGSDAMEGWVLDSMPVKDFEKKYKNKSPVSFGSEDENPQEDTVQICEYFKIEEESREVTYVDGQMVDFTDGMEGKPRAITKRRVRRYLMSGADVLEEGYFPGQYIPLVPVFGEEDFVDGKRKVYSLIRKSKDAQRAFNFWKSLEAELLSKQPKANFTAAEGQVEEYKEDYTDANKTPVLRYKPLTIDGQLVGPPTRLPPPLPPTGIMQASQIAASEIQATLGIYGAGIGDRTNEVSGVAIDSRKLESDVATYHFSDNLIKSITHVGKILVCAIPEVYDTPRIIRIIGNEDNPESIGINGAFHEGQKRTYDLVNGEYDVRVITGAPFTTRRQEAAKLFENVITRNPQLMQVMGDLMFENSDIEGADVIAKRMKKMIDPKLLEEEEGDDPRLMQLMQTIDQMKGQMQQMAEQLEDKKMQMAIDQEKNKIELQKAQLDAQTKMQELQLKTQEIAFERERLAVENRALMNAQPTNIAANATI